MVRLMSTSKTVYFELLDLIRGQLRSRLGESTKRGSCRFRNGVCHVIIRRTVEADYGKQ